MKNPLLLAIYNIFGQKVSHNEDTKIAVCIYFATLYIQINSVNIEDFAGIELHILDDYLFKEIDTTNKIYNMLLNSEIENAANTLKTLLEQDLKLCTKVPNALTH